MKADLYVYSDSFKYNGIDTVETLLLKLKTFKDLTQRVPSKDNQFLFNNNDFLNTIFLPNGETCHDLIFGISDLSKNRDIRLIFKTFLTSGVFHVTNFTPDEIDELIGEHSEDSCSAKVVLSKESINDKTKQLLGTYDDWLIFRSYFLGLYPGDVDFFYDECKKYYPNLKFGTRYKSMTKEVLVSHSERLTECLQFMNSKMKLEYQDFKGSNIDFPSFFSKKYNLDGGSFEGKKDEKFEIVFDTIPPKTLICEPHLKFNTPDPSKINIPGINNYCRIYFCIPSEENDKYIYVGAIVKHL